MEVPSPGDELVIPLEKQRPLSVFKYEQMIEAGILGEDDRVELLGGVLIEMTPQNLPHQKVIQRLNISLVRSLADDYSVRCQLPLQLGEFSEPEPDFAVTSKAEGDADHTPRQALWVIEIADSSLRIDRVTKAAIYARAAVPEYWIINTRDRCIEVFREPDTKAGRFRSMQTIEEGQSLKPRELPGPTVDVGALLR
jgi:Uma2 family endonuclease